MAELFKGSGVALVTPFRKTKKGKLKVDYDALKNLVKFHKKNDTDAIIICGTTGEASTLSDEEQIKTIKRCVEFTKGKIPVIAGSGSNDTEHAIYLSKEAAKVGADGLLCVTPYYNGTSQDGLREYYKDIAENVKIPIIMYNVPSRTGVDIAADTAIDIAKNVKNVIGIKEASGNLEKVKTLCDSGVLDVYSGNDDQIYDVMKAGGKGVISVLANIFPKETHEIVASYLRGETELSEIKQVEALELIKSLFSEKNPMPVKKACEYMGLCEGYLRKPLIEINEIKTKKLIYDINEYKEKK